MSGFRRSRTELEEVSALLWSVFYTPYASGTVFVHTYHETTWIAQYFPKLNHFASGQVLVVMKKIVKNRPELDECTLYMP